MYLNHCYQWLHLLAQSKQLLPEDLFLPYMASRASLHVSWQGLAKTAYSIRRKQLTHKPTKDGWQDYHQKSWPITSLPPTFRRRDMLSHFRLLKRGQALFEFWPGTIARTINFTSDSDHEHVGAILWCAIKLATRKGTFKLYEVQLTNETLRSSSLPRQ